MFSDARFPDNLRRLLGVHGLTATQASRLLRVSPQALSDWSHGKRQPGMEAVVRISELFEVPSDRLVKADFGDLLENELADRERFDRVEAKVRGASGRKPRSQ